MKHRGGDTRDRTAGEAKEGPVGGTVVAVVLCAWAVGLMAFYYYRHDFLPLAGQLWTALFG